MSNPLIWGITTIMVALLTVGVAFINTTAAFMLLSIYLVLTILSGWLVGFLQTKLRQRPHRCG